ncbi:hypothetical protein [uncultured Serinicoccus sp.]|uniref:hypothetical protein n=1 Tax=uncultured Serinicoccus sp. TaxID=735514 RepID=UPI002604D154|nr:hypothetical protein [uncultured Serinicoccus sp.]
MSTTQTGPTLDELRRAYRAAARGDYRAGADNAPQRAGTERRWDPAEPVTVVAGCHGGAGASILAAAVATVHPGASRVVEGRAAAASGFCAAATAELGQSATGWIAGARGDVRLERGSGLCLHPDDVTLPDPAPDGTALTVLDLSWDPRVLAHATGWLTSALLAARSPVLVTTATMPGMRHLEAVLHALPQDHEAVAVVRGGHRSRRWPTPVEQQTGPRARDLRQAGRVVTVPTEPQLAITGLDSSALPGSVLAAAAHVLALAYPAGRTSTTTTTTQESNR